MPIIKRFLTEEFLNQIIVDFQFLIKIVNNSYGELELAIRDGYLSLYYKGNSIAKISSNKENQYVVNIHKKFFNGTKADYPEFYERKTVQGEYVSVLLTNEKPPRRFLQKAHITEFARRVKQVNYGEEITFEQVIITDNLGREDLILIDRQVTDNKLRGKRMDLLALEQIRPDVNQYGFLVIEVKMGNNLELKTDVAHQLQGYVQHIIENFQDYKNCYEIQYEQKRQMTLLEGPRFDQIKIVNQVNGLVAVGGYSKLAIQYTDELKRHSPEIKIKRFENRL